jgi:hypothetical protein
MSYGCCSLASSAALRSCAGRLLRGGTCWPSRSRRDGGTSPCVSSCPQVPTSMGPYAVQSQQPAMPDRQNYECYSLGMRPTCCILAIAPWGARPSTCSLNATLDLHCSGGGGGAHHGADGSPGRLRPVVGSLWRRRRDAGHLAICCLRRPAAVLPVVHRCARVLQKHLYCLMSACLNTCFAAGTVESCTADCCAVIPSAFDILVKALHGQMPPERGSCILPLLQGWRCCASCLGSAWTLCGATGRAISQRCWLRSPTTRRGQLSPYDGSSGDH